MGVRLIHERNWDYILDRHDEFDQEDGDETAIKTKGSLQEAIQRAKDREKARWKFDSTKVDFKKLEKQKPPSIKFKISSSPNNNESVQYSDFDMPDIRSENSRMVIPDERYSDGGYPSERTIEYSEF